MESKKNKPPEWEEWEIQIALDPKLTMRQKMELTGRSDNAIYTRRHLMRIKSLMNSKNVTFPEKEVWHGCSETCPDWCPYSDCLYQPMRGEGVESADEYAE